MGAASQPPQLQCQQGAHGAARRNHVTSGHAIAIEQGIELDTGQIVHEEEEASKVGVKAAWRHVQLPVIGHRGPLRAQDIESPLQPTSVKPADTGCP